MILEDVEKNIIRIEKISKDFSVVNQITIYNYDSSNNFIKRIDATEGFIKDKNWQLNKVYIISANKKNNKENYLNQSSKTTITVKLHYFTRTPIKKPEPIW